MAILYCIMASGFVRASSLPSSKRIALSDLYALVHKGWTGLSKLAALPVQSNTVMPEQTAWVKLVARYQ